MACWEWLINFDKAEPWLRVESHGLRATPSPEWVPVFVGWEIMENFVGIFEFSSQKLGEMHGNGR